MQSNVSPSGASTAGDLNKPLVIYNSQNVKNNIGVASYTRIFAALLAGCITGILGITGFKGFLVFISAQIINAVALAVKAGFRPRKYFVHPLSVFCSGLVSQTEWLTFILFWTLSNNLVYLF